MPVQPRNSPNRYSQGVLDPASRDFYIHTLQLLNEAQISFMLGGAYALAQYTGIERHTKDLDIFVHPRDAQHTLDVLQEAGYETKLTFSHWLGKAHCGEDFVDVIFSSGNGACPVDDDWFRHATRSDVFGVPVLLMPPEEMIWQKSLILERERYDGADVAHLLHALAEILDWERLLKRFHLHWRVLLSHLILFGFIYPSERNRIPADVMEQLLERLRQEHSMEPPSEKICHGTVLSRQQYLVDVRLWGYTDARLATGHMSALEIQAWTESIE